MADLLGNIMTQGSYQISDWNTHLVDPEKKDAKWGYNIFISNKPYLRTAFASGGQLGTYSLDYDLIRQYAYGNQPENIYRVMFDPQDKQAIYTGLNWTVASPIPTLRARILKDMADVPSDVNCQAVDEMANNQRNMDKLRLKAQPIIDKKLAQFSAKMGLDVPMKSGFDKQILNTPMQQSPDLGLETESDDEIDIYMDKESGYYNSDVELANELAIKAIFEYNDFEKIRLMLHEDAFDYGIGAFRTYISTADGMPKFQYLRPDRVFVQRSKYRDFNDINMWYYPVPATLAEIRDYFGDELTENDAKEIWEGAAKRRPADYSAYPSWYTWDWRRWNYDDLSKIEIDMFYFEVKTTNMSTYEVSTTKGGTKKYKKKSLEYEQPEESIYDKKKVNYSAEVWYKGYYVQGLSKVYKWGMVAGLPRKKGDEKKCQSTLNLYKFSEKGWTEMMIPWENMYQLNFLKLQFEIMKALPRGKDWNWEAISRPFIGSAGTITAEKMMQMYYQTGNSMYHSLDEMGEPIMANANAPHHTNENGISPEARQYGEYMIMAEQQMAQCIGINPTVDAVNPPDRLGLGVQQNAIRSASNARYLLIDGIQNMIVSAAEYTSYCLQYICKEKGRAWERVKAMVGSMNLAVVESMEDSTMRELAIYPKAIPDEAVKTLIYQMVMTAYNKPQPELDLVDVFNIITLKNTKLAMRLFELKQKRKQAINAKMAQAGMQMQQQQMQQQSQLEIMLEKMASDAKTQTADITGRYSILQEQIKQQADTNQKVLSEINKIQLAREKQGHEVNLTQMENQNAA